MKKLIIVFILGWILSGFIDKAFLEFGIDLKQKKTELGYSLGVKTRELFD